MNYIGGEPVKHIGDTAFITRKLVDAEEAAFEANVRLYESWLRENVWSKTEDEIYDDDGYFRKLYPHVKKAYQHMSWEDDCPEYSGPFIVCKVEIPFLTIA